MPREPRIPHRSCPRATPRPAPAPALQERDTRSPPRRRPLCLRPTCRRESLRLHPRDERGWMPPIQPVSSVPEVAHPGETASPPRPRRLRRSPPRRGRSRPAGRPPSPRPGPLPRRRRRRGRRRRSPRTLPTARSPAPRRAIRTLSTRFGCPLPTPRPAPASFASTIPFDFTAPRRLPGEREVRQLPGGWGPARDHPPGNRVVRLVVRLLHQQTAEDRAHVRRRSSCPPARRAAGAGGALFPTKHLQRRRVEAGARRPPRRSVPRSPRRSPRRAAGWRR
jgi:hypothetical protein